MKMLINVILKIIGLFVIICFLSYSFKVAFAEDVISNSGTIYNYENKIIELENKVNLLKKVNVEQNEVILKLNNLILDLNNTDRDIVEITRLMLIVLCLFFLRDLIIQYKKQIIILFDKAIYFSKKLKDISEAWKIAIFTIIVAPIWLMIFNYILEKVFPNL